MKVENFKAEHLHYLLDNGLMEEHMRPYLSRDKGLDWEKAGNIFTILDEDKPVVIGGIIHYWHNRGGAWLIIGKPKTQHFVSIFKIVQRFMEISHYQRIEMVVEYDFAQGHRWAKLLGFKKEADRLRKYNPDGGDVTLYALVRE